MKYYHRFLVNAPLATVVEFHRQSASMGAITPPPIVVQVHHAPPTLSEGDEMDFTLWVGPVPLRWRAKIEQVTPTSFVDRQVNGIFAKWVHRHTFVQIDAITTEVIDEVTAELGQGWHRNIIGLSMWFGLPLLFTYRAWRTRSILNRSSQEIEQSAP